MVAVAPLMEPLVAAAVAPPFLFAWRAGFDGRAHPPPASPQHAGACDDTTGEDAGAMADSTVSGDGGSGRAV